MTTFDSLTLALEDWFATPLSELPDAVRQRVEKEFAPMPWEQLSAEQRRTIALQMDYQNDPATEQDQQFWWDHYWRQDELKAQIAQWEATAAPTAGELALRETRLKELRQELARMALQERQARGDYHPERKPLDGASETSPASQGSVLQYVAYPKAMAQLRKRLDATPEELAAWIWDGPKDGGIAAYVNANELDPPPRFYFALGSGRGDDHDYVSPLMACWFREDELAEFNPADRYITGEALIKRWAERPGLKAEAWVLAKIRESRLSDLHPLYGITKGACPEDAHLPPVASGLFQLSDVEAIEAEDFPIEWDACAASAGPSIQASEQVSESEVALVDNEVRQLPEVGRTAEAATGPPIASGVARKEPGTLNLPCEVFQRMPKLRADELTIAFVGDRSDAGLGANNMLEISARKTTRRVPMAALGLVDRRKGGPNNLAVILLGMATGRRLTHSTPNATKVTRVRNMLRATFGLAGDPFQPYRKHEGWVPHFKLVDKRGAADERAKREGEWRTESLDTATEYQATLQHAQVSHRDFEAEGDDADDWLQQHDRGDSA